MARGADIALSIIGADRVDLASGTLVKVLDVALPDYRFCPVYGPDHPRRAAIEIFVDWIVVPRQRAARVLCARRKHDRWRVGSNVRVGASETFCQRPAMGANWPKDPVSFRHEESGTGRKTSGVRGGDNKGAVESLQPRLPEALLSASKDQSQADVLRLF